MIASVLNKEVNAFVPTSTWLIRMPLVATFAAQVAKLRSVTLVLWDQERSLDLWAFIALTALQGALAVWALLYACPGKQHLELLDDSTGNTYEVRAPPLVSPARCLSTVSHRTCTAVSGARAPDMSN
jgi:hypothetical protein